MSKPKRTPPNSCTNPLFVMPLSKLKLWVDNYNEGDVGAIAASIERFGYNGALRVWRDNVVIGGNHSLLALMSLKARGPLDDGQVWPPVHIMTMQDGAEWVAPCIDISHLDELEARAFAIADNDIARKAVQDAQRKAQFLIQLQQERPAALEAAGWTSEGLDVFLADLSGMKQGASETPLRKLGSLADRFVVPPFSVLDARQGYWQERKHAWLALGIASELGRDEDLAITPTAARLKGGNGYEADYSASTNVIERVGTSVFDPVLCELAYRWFCPDGGRILDPFAGGSVRGIVASFLGRPYVGIDLAQRQVDANRGQWLTLASKLGSAVVTDQQPPVADPDELTPIQEIDGVYLKRDDLFEIAGVRGGKARTCLSLAQGATGLCTAGSRSSPQVNIVAHVAQALGIPCRVHVPGGNLTPELMAAVSAGAEVVQHRAGYNTVIIARARDDAADRGWCNIPFGMEDREAVEQTRRQVANIPRGAKRIVVPVGSGMSLSGILHGMLDNDKIPVLGVVVGADPTKRLDEYAPANWREMVELVPSGSKYDQPAEVTTYGGIQLDPYYEAKCLPFLEPDDCLWVVGIRQTAIQAGISPQLTVPAPEWIVGDSRNLEQLVKQPVDFIFSCPPYGDLEQYSKDPADLSNMTFEHFTSSYKDIIAQAVALLKPDRFACFVVGDFRDKRGVCRNFVSLTIEAFQHAGAMLYNEAVLITVAGSLPIRAARQFPISRKLGKSHQNVLLFYKGDPKHIRDMGVIEIPEEVFAPETV